MGAVSMLVVTLAGAMCFSGVYSGLDMKYGDKGFLSWSAFTMLTVLLSGGPAYAAVAAVIIAGGMVAAIEPFAVLMVSMIASKLLCLHLFRAKADDVQVPRRPYEEEIREFLFLHDPSQLHLVDAQLDRFKGQERHLLRQYKAKYAASPTVSASDTVDPSNGRETGGGRGSGGPKSVVQMAHEDEAKRVQDTIEASLQRITNRINRRR